MRRDITLSFDVIWFFRGRVSLSTRVWDGCQRCFHVRHAPAPRKDVAATKDFPSWKTSLGKSKYRRFSRVLHWKTLSSTLHGNWLDRFASEEIFASQSAVHRKIIYAIISNVFCCGLDNVDWWHERCLFIWLCTMEMRFSIVEAFADTIGFWKAHRNVPCNGV